MASGPLESVNIDGRRFTVDGEVDGAKALSGFMNEMKPNGDGSFRMVKSRKTGRYNSLPLVIDNDRGDEEYLQEKMDSFKPYTVSFTEVDGKVWSGSMQIAEDPETSSKEGTKEVSFAGSLRLQP
jgi:hypothetical protein